MLRCVVKKQINSATALEMLRWRAVADACCAAEEHTWRESEVTHPFM